MHRPDLTQSRLCQLALASICVAAMAPPAGAQSLASLAGRWKMSSYMSSGTPAATDAPQGAAAGKALRKVPAARAARQAAKGKQTVQTDTTAATPPVAIPTPTATPLSQTITVLVHGDTLFSIDSTTTATGTIARTDTFVVNGKQQSFTPGSRAGALLAARPAAQAKQNTALGARAAQVVQNAQGVRLSTPAPEGVGFTSTDSVSLDVAKRSLAIRTETVWALSADGKTLTIDSKTTGIQGTTTPVKRVFSRPES